eukprot:2161_1
MYQNGECHPASALPNSETLECEEDIGCVCSLDAECPYAIFKHVLSSQNEDTCPGLEWQEETVVLNQCVRGEIGQSEVHSTCGDDGSLSKNTCAYGQNDGNVSTPCAFECVNTHSHREACSGDDWTERAYLLNECIT